MSENQERGRSQMREITINGSISKSAIVDSGASAAL
jgi:hypothetical protein